MTTASSASHRGVTATDLPVKVTGLGKSYGDHVALEGLDLEVPAGKIVALLGPNGAGKSSAFRCILGFATATTGSALVYGAPLPRADDVRKRVGFAMQPAGLRPQTKVQRHLALSASLLGLPAERVEAVLDECGLDGHRRSRIGDLSTGLAQRCSLASALLPAPSLLVLDEPANGLDAEGILWLRNTLRRHAERGGAVLFSSHLLHEVEQIADEVTILSRTARFQGPMSQLLRERESSLEDEYFRLVGTNERAQV